MSHSTPSLRDIAMASRTASRALTACSNQQRQHILQAMEQALHQQQDRILEANQQDIDRASTDTSLSSASKARLLLTAKKIDVLRDGITQIANGPDPIGRLLRHTQLADGLELKQVSVPIGVLLIIFESRPDVLPQIAALAVRSGNGIILKGGHESSSSISCLHSIICSSITESTNGAVNGTDLIGLVHSRSEISELLKLEDCIDLIIPRGSSQLVKYIQQNTKIPVMGHAEGVCHVYIDSSASLDKAIRLIIDSKCDYPAACNAMETLLIHKKWLTSEDEKQSGAEIMISALRAAGVTVYAGPHATSLATTFSLPPATDLHHEYGDLSCTAEIVDNINIAIDHIHKYGSSHTESIITEDISQAQYFITRVDAACVFHNTSTRFADGYRMGLGAEVGISTGRLHARGPVGVEGLTSTKWIITSNDSHTASQFSKGESTFIHQSLPINQ